MPRPAADDERPQLRAFLAIPFAAPILDRIEAVQQQLRPELPQIRWTRRANLHLTLHFFGDIAEENLDNVADIMVSVGSLFAPFPLTLTAIGAFPSCNRARVVWIGVESERLGELYRALQTRLRAAGFASEERAFRPHITIGRCRQRPGRIMSQQQAIVGGDMEVSTLTLFESRLLPSGAEHHPRHTVRLAEPGQIES